MSKDFNRCETPAMVLQMRYYYTIFKIRHHLFFYAETRTSRNQIFVDIFNAFFYYKIRLVQQAVALAPTAKHYDTLAYTYYRNAQYSKALEAINKAIAIAPNVDAYNKLHAKGEKMKKGICIGSLPGSSTEARFKLAKEAGFDGVEIGTLGNDSDRHQAKAIAEEHSVEIISVMNSKHWACPLSDADDQVRAESRAGMLDSIATAKAVGAETVLLVPAVVNNKTSYEAAYQRSQAEIRKLIPAAKDNQITIALENVWNKFLLSPIEFCRYIDEFDNETVAAYFDVGNIVLYGYPQQWIRSLGNRITKVHVKGFNASESRFTYLIEDCTIDWNAVMSALAEVGYDDYMTAELPVDGDNPEGRVHSISDDMDRIIAGTV